jgi:hypothetical protein
LQNVPLFLPPAANGGANAVVKVQETILVTTQDVLDYLQGCGITAKYSKSNPQVYWWKRMSLSQLVAVANSQRRSQQLPPFRDPFLTEPNV